MADNDIIYEEDPKPKRKRGQTRRWRWLWMISLIGGLGCCGLLLVLALLGPVIGNVLTPSETIYVTPQVPVIVQPASVTYRAADVPVMGGVFTNGEWLNIQAQALNVRVEDDRATVNMTVTFANVGDVPIDGVFLIPLPSADALETLTVTRDGDTQRLTRYSAVESRAQVLALAREHGDTSLLAYADRPLAAADIFPLAADTPQSVNISYTATLARVNGLIALDLPLALPVMNGRVVGEFTVTLNASAGMPLRNIYPATLDLEITQDEPTAFVGYTTLTDFTPPQALTVYYAPSDDEITANVLTFREDDAADGYFVLLVAPSPEAAGAQLVNKDVMLVLDQSGSMGGVKWEQAQAAGGFVLEHLNSQDRFHVTTFSSSVSFFDNRLSPASASSDAVSWINSKGIEGGTNINDALVQTLQQVDAARPTTLLFMTDGVATEGVQDTATILANLRAAAGENVRIFTFGVGDDVNTVLLDSIAREFRGQTGYVRPNETIDAEIRELYAKIASPVLTDITVDFGDTVAGDFVPSGQLPDLFAGEQLIIVGRYRRGGEAMRLTLQGMQNGEPKTYTFDGLQFESGRGGTPFVAQLWATRRIGELLNRVRLGDDNTELVNSIVSLSLRYGIITPYTQFLLEQEGVLTQAGQQAANAQMAANALNLQQNQVGAAAVDAADTLNRISASRNIAVTPSYGFGIFSSGSYYSRSVVVAVTPTPIPALNTEGALLNIAGQDYIISLNPTAFEQAMADLPAAARLDSAPELLVTVGNLVGYYGASEGIRIYNEIYGAYLPLIAVERATTPDGYEVTQPPPARPPLRSVAEKVFILADGVYTDTTYQPDNMTAIDIIRDSDAYSALIAEHPALLPYLSAGESVIVVWGDKVYSIRGAE